MTSRQAQRDREEEMLERDRYVTLLHIYTLSYAGPATSVAPERIARDLGFTEVREDRIVRDLLVGDYVRFAGWGLALTRKGTDYIEQKAGRRRSLRLFS